MLHRFSTDPDAESTINIVAKIFGWFFWAIEIILLIGGIYYIIDHGERWWWVLVVIGICALIGFVGDIFYARLRIFVNISHTLYNIEGRLQQIEYSMYGRLQKADDNLEES